MKLDQDKQIEDLAEFQQNILGPEKLEKITENHLRNQGIASDEQKNNS